MITLEKYIEAKKIVSEYKKEGKDLDVYMSDVNGVVIRPGHKIRYQIETNFEAEAEVFKKDGVTYIGNWSDDCEDFKAVDFWHEPTDRKITIVLNP